MSYPIENGVIKCWDDMVNLWTHCFNQLKVDPSEWDVLLTEASLDFKNSAGREKMVEEMFETF